jgi:hypothetical protein
MELTAFGEGELFSGNLPSLPLMFAEIFETHLLTAR